MWDSLEQCKDTIYMVAPERITEFLARFCFKNTLKPIILFQGILAVVPISWPCFCGGNPPRSCELNLRYILLDIFRPQNLYQNITFI